MKKISALAIAGVLVASGFALPAFAASSAPALATGQVPACDSSSAVREMKDGVYADQIQSHGLSIDSLELWNGCVKVIYSDSSGQSGTAFYDPDTLQLLQSSGPSAPTFG